MRITNLKELEQWKKKTAAEYLWKYTIDLILHDITSISIICLIQGTLYTESDRCVLVAYYLWDRDAFYTAHVFIEESKFLLHFARKEKYEKDTCNISPSFLFLHSMNLEWLTWGTSLREKLNIIECTFVLFQSHTLIHAFFSTLCTMVMLLRAVCISLGALVLIHSNLIN